VAKQDIIDRAFQPRGGNTTTIDLVVPYKLALDSNQLLLGDSDYPVPTTQVEALTYIIDGGGVAITTGVKGDLYLPYDLTVEGWTLLANPAGAIVVDLWADSYANYPPTVADTITASAKPTIAATNAAAQSSTLTGWTTSLPAGRTIRLNVDSCATITRCTVILTVRRAL